MPDRAQLEAILARDPNDLFLNYALAMVCAGEGDEQEAAERLARLCEQHPDYVPAWFQRGQILNRLGETAQSREVITAGIAAAQRTGDSHAAQEMREFLELLGD